MTPGPSAEKCASVPQWKFTDRAMLRQFDVGSERIGSRIVRHRLKTEPVHISNGSCS
jgi:hypothetical protein